MRSAARPGLRRVAKLSAVLVAASLCGLVPACDAHSSSSAASASAACRETRYLLRVSPGTLVSNERQRVQIRASRDSCGHRAPVIGGRVTLSGRRATTDSRGRATLRVQLRTGRYLVRLYIHGQFLVSARVRAIPNVSR